MDNHINLQPMWPMREALDHDDNWTGLTNAQARRRRQNRLNQRAHRRRKEKEALTRATQPHRADGMQLYFPLSVDHLLTLIQFNAYRAFLTNMKILALPTIFSCGDPTSLIAASCASSLELDLPTATTATTPGNLPPYLIPTPLQLSLTHEPWIDLFPLPALRDNLLRFRGQIDSCELCDDILGTMFEDQVQSPNDNRNGLIIWGEPWDVASWELMEGFVAKWGFLLVGCEVLIDGTNRWRATRGEEPLWLKEDGNTVRWETGAMSRSMHGAVYMESY
ncbi:hypothetical protein BJX63DRAFT_436448 [Aspergillus granulosus]|uniref:BZIP domain-containing protein n=1 Tax=Aspergillus granulosus TaxID=176169 RepID=A0ABR4GY24_9EURO